MRSRIDAPATLQVYRFEIPYAAGGRHIIIENATRFVAHVALMACADVAQVNANRATTIPPFATTRVDLSPSELPRVISLYLDPQLYTTIPALAQWIDVRDADPVTPGVSVPVGVEGKAETVPIVSYLNTSLGRGYVYTEYVVQPGEIIRISSTSYQIQSVSPPADALAMYRLLVNTTNLLFGAALVAGQEITIGSALIEAELGPGQRIGIRFDNGSATKRVSVIGTVWGRKFSIA